VYVRSNCGAGDFSNWVGPVVFATLAFNPPLNDNAAGAVNITQSGNAYPGCGVISGDCTAATDSPEDDNTGADVWFRFTAASSGVSITLTSSAMDDVITLFNNSLVEIASEDDGIDGSDFERLNFGGLTAGQQYYVCVSNYSTDFGVGGPFTLCLRHLMASYCSDGPGTYALCTNFKPAWTGANGYTFNFTGTGSTPVGPTAITATTQVSLASPALALQYGGTYNVTIDVTYNLTDSGGTPETIVIPGTSVCPISLIAQPNVEVKLSQRCASLAILSRGSYLNAAAVTPGLTSCGATSYTFEFTQVSDCSGNTLLGMPFTVNTPSASPNLNLALAFPTALPNAGFWSVRIRPNFVAGTSTFGPAHVISVNGTSMLSNTESDEQSAESDAAGNFATGLYPNPSNGEMVNLNVSGVESDQVFVRIFDGIGRVVYTNRFAVEGSLNTIVTFTRPLANGLYNVEFNVDGQVMTEHMIVAK
jgi:hypothetical protein